MRKLASAALVSGIVLLVIVQGWAADLRGRVDAVHRYSKVPFPAQGIEVSLVSARGRVVDRALTGSDGLYYFYGVRAGRYRLEVKGSRDEDPHVYQLDVDDVRRQEVRPILVRY